MEKIVTIDTAAASYNLTSLATVKSELGITALTDDTLLTSYIASESDKIANYCNRIFFSEKVTETFYLDSPYGNKFLQLTRNPVTTVHSVADASDTLTTDDYDIDNAYGIIYRVCDGCRIGWGSHSAVITYTAGPAAVPASVADACVQMVARRYLARGRDATIQSEEIPGVSSVRFFDSASNDGFSEDVKALLNPHKRYAL